MPATNAQLEKIVKAIHSQPELHGCTIGYEGGGMSRVLHPGFAVSNNYGKLFVVIEDVDVPRTKVPAVEKVPTKPAEKPAPTFVTNESRFWAEAAGAGINCTLTVVAAVGVVGSAAAEVPTAGTSTLLLIASWTGMVTAGAQCINGTVRAVEAFRNPQSNTLQQWDENAVYKWAFLLIDGAGVASGVAALPQGLKNLAAILQRRGALKMSVESFARLDKAGRKAAIKEAVAQASKTPEGRKAILESMEQGGLKANQAANAVKGTVGTIRQGKLVLKAISKDLGKRLNAAVLDALGNSAGIAASFSPEKYTGSASGSMNAIVVNVFEVVQQ